MTRPTYDLLDEPWLPATRRDGARIELGITALLRDAHDLARLELETPDVLAGVWKMLLAVLHRAYDGPRDLTAWKAIWKAGRFDANRISAYLKPWRARFDLWDEKHPFLQDPSVEGEESSLSRLYVERAKGNNATLFDHTQDEDGDIVPAAVAARRLVGAQHFALGGRIEGAAVSAVGNPNASAAFILVEGQNVFETLCLNLCVLDATRPIPSSPADAPSWERDIATASARREHGYLDLLTWRPRRYRLIAADVAGQQVRGLVAKGEAERFEDYDSFRNPLCAYKVSRTAGFIEVRIDPERAIWRDSAALFSADAHDGQRPEPLRQVATLVLEGVLNRSARFNVLAAGFATNKAKVLLSRIESFSVPATVVAEPAALNGLREALALAENVAREVRSAIFIAAKRSLSAGDRDPDPADASSLADSTGAQGVYWSSLGLAFSNFLFELATDLEKAELQWRSTLREAALAAFQRADVKLANSARGLRAVVYAKSRLFKSLAIHLPQTTTTEQPHELA